MALRFAVGDRVRPKRQLEGLPPDVVGTIQSVIGFNDLYDVLFDGTTEPRILIGDALELVGPGERQEDAEPGE